MYNMIAFECKQICYIHITNITYDSYYSYDYLTQDNVLDKISNPQFLRKVELKFWWDL